MPPELSVLFPNPFQNVRAIEPEPGSTCLDAENIVIPMQGGRRSITLFGTLQGCAALATKGSLCGD